MNKILIIFMSLLVSISNQEFDIKAFYEPIPPNHEWKEIGGVKIFKSVNEVNAIEFNKSQFGVAWNSFEVSQDEDFLISFDLIIYNLSNLNDTSEQIFKFLMTSNSVENGNEKNIGDNFGTTINDSIGFKLDMIREEATEKFNISFIKNLEGDETYTPINKIHLFNEFLKYHKINIKISIIENQLSFIINNKKIIKNQNINGINRLLEKQKTYINLISFSKIKLAINDFKIIKIIKPLALTYEYKIIKNNLNSIAIQVKDKYNNNISINVLKNMKCYFDKSYIKEESNKYYFQQIFKNDTIELIPNIKINNMNNQNYNFVLRIKCLKNEKIWLNCNNNFINKENICYFEPKKKKMLLRKLELNENIIITVKGYKGDIIPYINKYFFDENRPKEVYLNNNKTNNYNISYSIVLNKDGLNVIEVVWDKKLINLEYMFDYCSSIESIDLSHVDTSHVTDMNNMFSGCSSLISLNLSNLDTSRV